MASGPFMNPVNADRRREEFRRYLESKGVLETLTRAIAKLNEEPQLPPDPMQYVLDMMCAAKPGQPTIDAMTNMLDDAHTEIDKLKAENKALEEKVKALETAAAAKTKENNGGN